MLGNDGDGGEADVDMIPAQNASSENPKAKDPIVVMYFGAGRGPLIRKALMAATREQVTVKVIALDKNPNAIVTLRNMIYEEKWQDQVELISGDMRKIDVKDL